MNIIRNIFILLFVVVTVVAVIIRPGVHNPMILENSDFQLTSVIDDVKPIPQVLNQEQTKTVQEIKVTDYKGSNTTQQITYDSPNPKTQTRKVEIRKTQQPSRQINIQNDTLPADTSQLEMLQKIIKNAEQAQTYQQQPAPKREQIQTPKSEPKQQVVEIRKADTPKNTKPSSNPYMTEEEEIIAWNVWRSNIHNQIMKDSDIGTAFMGTVFSFSFVVDKFGNVSNIKVEAFPDYFMDIARDGVKPAIARLQNKPILEFPRGTKRTSTVVEGKFAVGTVNRFSTPNEYSDYERVLH